MSDIPQRVIELLREVHEHNEGLPMTNRKTVLVHAQMIRMSRTAMVSLGDADADAEAIRWLRHNDDRYLEAARLADVLKGR